MKHLDPRLNAVRPDLADFELQGLVQSARFVQAEILQVAAPQAPVRKAAAADAMLLTEALRGERVAVFERSADGKWVWAQLQDDRYVGWMPSDCLAEAGRLPTHKVTTPRTLVFGGPNIKVPPLMGLPLGARVNVSGTAEDKNARYALVEPSGAIVMQHLAPLDTFERDWTSVAERFVGAPYLWGGKTALGVDCSGLVQLSLGACGVPAPRDSDMQEAALGTAISPDEKPKRGDLVFWPGHVGLMLDADMLLHANSHHMAVAMEPLAEAVERLATRGVEVSSVRRVAAP